MPRNRRAELDREEKIAEIVAAAQRQLASGGYRAMSVKGIATELGLAQAALYWYFPSKDHLFVDAIQDAFLEAWSRKPRTAPLTRQVHWFADELAELQPYIVALRERAREADVAAEFLQRIETQLRSILASVLEAQTTTATPAETAEILLAVAGGLAASGLSRRRRHHLLSIALEALAPSPD